MMSATHMMGGVAAAASYLLIVSPDIPSVPMTAAALGIGAIGGLIPDIDHPSSKISRSLRPVNALVSLVFSHRGFSHPLCPAGGSVGLEMPRSAVPGLGSMFVYGNLLAYSSGLPEPGRHPSSLPCFTETYSFGENPDWRERRGGCQGAAGRSDGGSGRTADLPPVWPRPQFYTFAPFCIT